MTLQAIEAWRREAESKLHCPRIPSIASILLEASSRANLLADDSRDAFEGAELASLGSLEQLRAMLLAAL